MLCALLPFVLVAITAASCDGGSSTQASAQSSTHAAAPASTPAAVATCGTPPCDKYVSRSHTRTLDNDVYAHPIIAAVALHLVVSIICGGLLCVWGEGVTYVYVRGKIHDAAQGNECLRIHVLPQGRAWQLVNLDASNQSPYCTG